MDITIKNTMDIFDSLINEFNIYIKNETNTSIKNTTKLFDSFIDKLDKYIKDDTSKTRLSYSKGTRLKDGSYSEPYNPDDLNLTIFFINGSMVFVSFASDNLFKISINLSYNELLIKGYYKYDNIGPNDRIYYWNNFDSFFLFLDKIKIIRRTDKWDWTGSNHASLKYRERNFVRKQKLEPIYQNIKNKLIKNCITFTEDCDNHETYKFDLYHLTLNLKGNTSMILQEYWDECNYRIEIMKELSEEELKMLESNNIIIDNDYNITHFYDVDKFIDCIVLLSAV